MPKDAFPRAIRELVHIGNQVEAMHRNVIALSAPFHETAAQTIPAQSRDVVQRSFKLPIYLAGIAANGEFAAA